VAGGGKTATLAVKEGLATIRIDREHGNAVNPALVDDLMVAFQEAWSDPGVRGVMLTADGKLFCPGLDLQELAGFDRQNMARFMSDFHSCLLLMYTFSKPVVAALQGHTLAGGCVLAMTADHRILKDGALIGFNEVKVGVPLPYGICQILRESLPPNRLEEVAVLGINYTGDDAIRVGLAHETWEENGFEDYCRRRLEEFCERDLQAYATTKRYLRSPAVERIRANDRLFLQEFLDCWFSDGTRARIESILEGLKKREG
jgi:enoyl-CoA hydratase/carnithine racemase